MLRQAFVALFAIALLVAHPLPAAACSAGPFDPRDHTQLLVLGRARSIDIGAPTIAGFREATVTLDVIHTYRGAAPALLRFNDLTSVSVERDPRTGQQVTQFAGGSGACGTLDADPVGKYVLIALARGDGGRWHANRLFGAIFTDRPGPAVFQWVLDRHGVSPLPIGGRAPDGSMTALIAD